MIEPTQYFRESQVSIAGWKKLLDLEKDEQGNPLSMIDKKKIRGKIAALKTRIEKKIEVASLQEQISIFKDSLDFLANVMDEEFSDSTKQKVQGDIAEAMATEGK